MNFERICGYRIDFCPRYHTQSAIAENLLSQETFWSALQFLLVADPARKLAVELRFVCHRDNLSVSTYFWFLRPREEKTVLPEEMIRRLLPKEYAWSRLSEDYKDEPLAGEERWRIARIVRRLEFMDLPTYISLDDSPKAPPQKSASGEAGSSKAAPNVSSVFLRDLEDAQSKHPIREVPESLVSSFQQIRYSRFCLPVLGEMQDLYPDQRRLCEELQASAPAVVSIGLHPLHSDQLDGDRQAAMHFRDFLELLSQPLENAGFSGVTELRRVFDRYLLTRGYMCNLTVRVAATTDEYATGLAHGLCGRLGGMRAFEVKSPTKTFASLHSLSDPDLDFPASEVLHEEWTVARRRLSSSLARIGVKDVETERFARFLIRMPHLFSMDEAHKVLRLPLATQEGLPGIDTRLPPPFNPPSMGFYPIRESNGRSVQKPPEDRIRIGRVSNLKLGADANEADKFSRWHTLPANDLCKHALIVGSTGSGKTVTTLFLLREIIRLGLPFLVIEPVKTEYFTSLQNLGRDGSIALNRFRFEGTAHGERARDFLGFDPMRLQRGVTVARHVSYLKSCFEAAFPMDPWQTLFLENAMLDYYLAPPSQGGCGLRLFTRGSAGALRISGTDKEKKIYPSFETFCDYFLGHFLDRELGRPDPSKPGARIPASAERLEEFRQIFRRRFENLGRGPLGEAFRKAKEMTIRDPVRLFAPFSYLLEHATVVELDAIPDGDQKALAMAFLMTFLYERRQADDLLAREAGRKPDANIKHVLVVEEAHRLLSHQASGGKRKDSVGQDSRAKAVSLFVDMLAEIRAFGQGLMIVEQIPAKLVPDAVKNTNLKIMLRLTSGEDRDSLGDAMSFNQDQRDFVNTLRAEPGRQVQYVAFDENVDQPVLLSLPLPRTFSGNLFDEYFQDTKE